MRWYWWAAIAAAGAYFAFRGGQTAVSVYRGYQVEQFAKAISIAEGTSNPDGSLNPNSLGIQRNNPGDIEDSMGVIVTFSTITDGWNALYDQCSRMLYGTSKVYTPDMSIMRAAQLYTGGDNAVAWAQSVAQTLGLSITNTLGDVATLAA